MAQVVPSIIPSRLVCRLAIAAVLLSSGCDVVFRLHETTAADAALDAPTALVAGTNGWQVIDNDRTGVPQPMQVQLFAPDAHVVLADDREVAITDNADGSFAFPLDAAGQSYHYAFETQFSRSPQEIDDVADTLTLTTPLFGRVARTPVTLPTTLTIATSVGAASAAAVYLVSTGLRSATPRQTGTPAIFTQDWSLADSSSGAIGLLDPTLGDRLWALSLPDVPASAAYVINSAGSAQVTIVDGAAQTIAIPTPLVPATQCVTVAVSRRAELTRVAQQVAGVTAGSNESSAWELQSTPFPAITPAGGIPLVITDVVAPAAATPESHAITFGNPFPGEGEIAVMVADLGHAFALPGTTAVIEYAGTTVYTPVPAALPCPSTTTVALNALVAIPSTPTLNGIPLDLDNRPLDIPRDHRVPLTFPPGVDGRADDFQVVMYEVFSNAANATQFRQLKVYTLSTPELDLDPAELIVGKSYVFAVIARMGFPNSAHGDFSVETYPFGTAVVYSAIVRVAS